MDLQQKFILTCKPQTQTESPALRIEYASFSLSHFLQGHTDPELQRKGKKHHLQFEPIAEERSRPCGGSYGRGQAATVHSSARRALSQTPLQHVAEQDKQLLLGWIFKL